MSNNDLVRVEFGTVTNTDNQIIYKDLNSLYRLYMKYMKTSLKIFKKLSNQKVLK